MVGVAIPVSEKTSLGLCATALQVGPQNVLGIALVHFNYPYLSSVN